MGEESGEDRPFLYFTDHDDPRIAAATREGRRREFAAFAGFGGELPDPQDPETFARSVLSPADPDPGMRTLWRDLLALRRRLGRAEAEVLAVDEEARTLRVRRGGLELCLNLSPRPAPGAHRALGARPGHRAGRPRRPRRDPAALERGGPRVIA